MGLFQKKCIECKAQQTVKRCPFCKKVVCDSCLKPFVLKDETPVWFVGKEVKNLSEYKALVTEYRGVFKKRSVKLHACEEYLQSAWKGIVSQVRSYEKQTNRKALKITLR
jgi:hypothetical protein